MRAALLALLAVAAASCPAPAPAPPADVRAGIATTADQLFSLDFVPTLELSLGARARRKLTDHPGHHVAARLRHGGRTYAVKVKLKGNRSFRTLDEKPGFRLDFDDAGFVGLRRLALNNLVDDPTGVREILAYRLYRAAGVPAPRTGYAHLRVDGADYGTYLMVEPVDDRALTARLGGPPAAIFEGEYGCDLFVPDAARIELKHGDAGARDRFAALAAAAERDPHQLFQPDGSPLDVAETLSFLAVDTWIGDFDGYWHSHNYFLADGPPPGRWRILPWGADRVFHHRLPIYDSQGRLARLCFADAACRLAYARRLREVSALAQRVTAGDDVRRLLALAAALVDGDRRSSHDADERRDARAELADFLAHRGDDMRAALTCLSDAGEVDGDGDGYGCLDCDDARADVHPGAAESCDRVDNDCDGLVDDAPACPCREVRAGGARFELCDLPMPWRQARDFCAARGMSLARLDSPAQARTVYQAAWTTRADRWWLGARQGDDGSFAWSDGHAFGFTHWNDGEPRNHRCQQSCLVLDDDGEGTWALGHCELYFPFVCRVP
ncbi:MAG TPA: CotH kinase family protein [Kofleriaceae bacterium]|nr:CotH kinase family protein [Kofleriaceae bacterium]